MTTYSIRFTHARRHPPAPNALVGCTYASVAYAHRYSAGAESWISNDDPFAGHWETFGGSDEEDEDDEEDEEGHGEGEAEEVGGGSED